jgi:Flp pilus assembly protein TadD
MALTSDPYKGAASVSGVIRMTSGDNIIEGRRRGEVLLIAERLGDSYQAIGRHDKAAQSWQIGVNKNPKPTAGAYLKVANAWERAGDVTQMGQAAQAASDQEPANPAAHYALARAFDKSNNAEWAIRHAQKSWTLDPKQAEVAILLGSLYETRGERRVARELYRDALRRHPSNTLIYAAFERVGGTRRR